MNTTLDRIVVIFGLQLLAAGTLWSDEEKETAVGQPRVVAPLARAVDTIERVAIERGLSYLEGRTVDSGAVGIRYPVAVTSLTGLAFLGVGHRHSFGGAYHSEIKGCLRYILASAQSNTGFITESTSQSRMHGHCLALLFLTQIHGELPPDLQQKVGRVIRAAIKCIARSQSVQGGWWYHAVNIENKDEASVTIGALQALRAARNIGFVVSPTCIQGARNYVGRCQNLDGGFRYSIAVGERRTSFALTAAAVSTLHSLGDYDSRTLQRGFDYMDGLLATARGRPRGAIAESFFYYGALYATQAYFQRAGDRWARWRSAMRTYLLSKQKSNGSWNDGYGDEFGTAMAVLILEVPVRYLPIFER